ncbi:hypothetical protein HDU67_008956 [Dinochytrium kinnereticum]|nr:hypothetical protein HDU67_008956 [Dinochytrium kinnereticum]
MTPQNVSEFLFSFAYKYEPLRRLATTFIVKEFNAVRLSEGFALVVREPQRFSEYSGILGEILNRVSVKGFAKVPPVQHEIGEDEEDQDGEEEEDDEDDLTLSSDPTTATTIPRPTTPSTTDHLKKCSLDSVSDGSGGVSSNLDDEQGEGDAGSG